MQHCNGTAVYAVRGWPAAGGAVREHSSPARVTAKRVAVGSRVYDRASGRLVSARYPGDKASWLVGYALGGGPVVRLGGGS